MTRQGGFGTVVKITVTSSLVAVTHAQDIEFPEFEKILADITGHDAPGGYEEIIATGKRKMNAFKLKLTWDTAEATHAAMVAAFNSDETVAMSVEDPDGDEVIAFDAHVAKLGRVAEQEEGYVCEVEIKPTGIPVIGS
jgi:predicted secreted protein